MIPDFCLQAGDKSLATVVAHEISHSWTGNLVTNANFEHFWLNEGFTMFIQGKITGHLEGAPARDFQALQGLSELQETVRYTILNLIEEMNLLRTCVFDFIDQTSTRPAAITAATCRRSFRSY